ncbi:MAG: bifunctional UDP-N-acetylglucosamine diphosphorylase/glucosamine-1-phosphate N-acetyltransferase GlmU [Acidobacteria bacterium]|nr:bifunctional UDP-N-acetylglucosamine diphosphorylase/glucosamine-1-phosphate N-acetyltransferase GlmU [Acidobacteriota bacterium]MBI3655352.1 bifunctional UDP-N-acetylglucosamine diphosphorylase/glucosamine-1-phosphate N-acetyltransferase GlmU [Acidobacteriota bacterium]
MEELRILILAAGKGTRMRSEKAKVLHTVCGVPLVMCVYNSAAKLPNQGLYVVVGEGIDEVKQVFSDREVFFIHQAKQLGTGHAVMTAAEQLRSHSGSLLVLNGDMPLVSTAILKRLADFHKEAAAAVTLLTARLENPYGYGRVVRTVTGEISKIVEERDASDLQRAILEINTGVYCFKIGTLFEALDKISTQNAQNEYYLTDVISVLTAMGQPVAGMVAPDPDEVLGVNTRYELATIEARVRASILKGLMESGVTIIDPAATYIDATVNIKSDTVIYPNCILEKSTRIGSHCTIHAASHLVNAQTADYVTVRESTVITDSTIGEYSTVGPFAHVREHTCIGSHCRVGNFVEIKKSVLGNDTKAAHLAYIGDAEIGEHVNIGAGTITCNYDGVHKNKTIIEDGVFIGSDSQLVAPVRIGKGAYVAAGSTITEDIPAFSLGIARGRQVVKEGWAQSRQKPNKPSIHSDPPAKPDK